MNNLKYSKQLIILSILILFIGIGYIFSTAPQELIYGDDITFDKTFSASGEYDEGHNAPMAFDDLSGTYWLPAQGTSPVGQWITVDMGAYNKKTVEKITLRNRLANVGIKNFDLKGSNDNLNWDTVYSSTATDDTAITSFIFSNSNRYRYYQIYCSSGYSLNTLRITEIEMMEVTNVKYNIFGIIFKLPGWMRI